MPRAKSKTTYVGPEAVDLIRQKLATTRLSQYDLGDAMGLDQPSISRVLKGTRRLKDTEFARAYEFIRKREENPAPAVGLRHALEQAAMPLAELAERSGLPVPRVAELLSSKDSPAPENFEIDALNTALGLPRRFLNSEEKLLEARLPTGKYGSQAGSPREMEVPEQDKLVIFGAPQASDFGEFRFKPKPIERREMPPVLRHVTGAFGMLIDSNLLAPRYEDGEIILVHPGISAGVGKWAFVSFPDETLIIGKVLKKGGTSLVIDVPGRGPVTVDVTWRLNVGKIVGTLSD